MAGKIKLKEGVKGIETSIEYLDEILRGGIPERSTVIVSGGMGTGKTIFTVQVLYNIVKKGGRCLFVSLEQDPEEIIQQGEQFGWKLRPLVDKERMIFNHHLELDYESLEINIENILRKYKDIKMVAVDPVSMLQIYFKSELGFRVALFRLSQILKKYETTSFLIDDSPTTGPGVYVADGVIRLEISEERFEKTRSLEIVKMRRSDHKLGPTRFKITSKGIVLSPHEASKRITPV